MIKKTEDQDHEKRETTHPTTIHTVRRQKKPNAPKTHAHFLLAKNTEISLKHYR